MAWSVYVTGWRDDRIIDEIPASGIEYQREISEHSKCAFTLPIPRGGASWLSIVRPLMTGVLVCEDDQVRWGGAVMARPRSGERSYRVDCAGWSTHWDDLYFTPDFNIPDGLVGKDRSRIVEFIARAVTSRPGADWPLELQVTDSGQTTDVIEDVQAASMKSVMAVIRDVCAPAGAPEWTMSVEGTATHPRRILRVAPRLGRRSVAQSRILLDFAAEAGRATPPSPRSRDRSATVLGNLYPTADQIFWTPPGSSVPVRRHGGNVLVDPGDDMTGSGSATRVWTTPEPTDRDQTGDPGRASSDALLKAGYPLRELVADAPADPTKAGRDRYAAGILQARSGFATTWRFSTFAGDPPLSEVQLGDQAGVVIESDAYSWTPPGQDPQPLSFETRLTGISVAPDDDAGASTAIVNYTSVTPAGALGY